MKCERPLLAVCLAEVGGKKKLKFFNHQGYTIHYLKSLYGENNVYQLPCGQCESCRVNYAHDWSVRIALESLYHKYGYFITLTFDDFHINKASRYDFKKLISNIRKKDPNVKFFACEELGDLTGRYHIHAIMLTDVDFGLYDPIKKGSFYHYHSEYLDHYWTNGVHDACEFDFFCSAYVAKYTSKQGSKVFMSRNIGWSYFADHWEDIQRDNFKIYEKFGNKSVIDCPRVFLHWFDLFGLIDTSEFKDAKRLLAHDVMSDKLVRSGRYFEEEVYSNDIKVQKSKQKGVIRNELA